MDRLNGQFIHADLEKKIGVLLLACLLTWNIGQRDVYSNKEQFNVPLLSLLPKASTLLSSNCG